MLDQILKGMYLIQKAANSNCELYVLVGHDINLFGLDSILSKWNQLSNNILHYMFAGKGFVRSVMGNT